MQFRNYVIVDHRMKVVVSQHDSYAEALNKLDKMNRGILSRVDTNVSPIVNGSFFFTGTLGEHILAIIPNIEVEPDYLDISRKV